MRPRVKRGVAAGGTVVLAGMVNVATGMLTQHWAAAWWASSAVLVLAGGGLQAWLTLDEGPAAAVSQKVHGTKVGGRIRQLTNHPGSQEVTASEAGTDLEQIQGG